MTDCVHVSRVTGWSVDTSQPTAPLVPSGWDCAVCGVVLTGPTTVDDVSVGMEAHDASCDCFACRVQTLHVAYCGIGGGDATVQKRWDQNLDLYRKAKAEGIQPTGTSPSKVQAAIRQSDKTGTAFRAG